MTPEHAFAPQSSRDAFVETPACADALRRLEAGLGAREPFLLVTGEPGTGKSALVNEAIARLEPRVAVARLACPAFSGAELIEEIVLRFGGEPDGGASRPRLLSCLERSLSAIAEQGKVALLVVDDAQQLSSEQLEELRLVANGARQSGRAFEVLLAGLPVLEARLEEPALAALRQRVAVRVRMEPLAEGEVRAYVRHRVNAAGADGHAVFPRKACAELAVLSNGVPRRLNALAGEALRLANAEGSASVQPQHVQAAAATLWTNSAAAAPAPAPVREAAPPAKSVATPIVKSEPAPAAKPTPVVKSEPAAAAKPAPTPVAKSEPAPAAKSATEPVAKPAAAPSAKREVERATQQQAEPATRPVKPAPAPRFMDELEPPPPPPTHHDPREWVARFVGDRGPVRIGSQVGGPIFDTTDAEPAGERPRLAPAAAAAPRPRKRGNALRLVTYSLLVTIATIVITISFLRWQDDRRHAARVRAAAAMPAPATARTTDPAPAVVPQHHVSAEPARSEAAAESMLVSPTGRYTVEVGSYADLQAAKDARDHAQQLTGIQGWVVVSPEGSGQPHRVVLGIYRSRERAAQTAKMLLGSRTLPTARLAALPKRGNRI